MATNQFDIFEVTARAEFNAAEDVTNVFQFQYLDAPSITEAVTVTDILNIIEQVYAILDAAMSVLLLFQDIRIANLTQVTLLGVHPWPTLTGGAEVNPPTAPGVALLTNFSTVVPRVGMRKFWGVFTDGNSDPDGTFSAALQGAGASAAALMLLPMTGPVGNYQFGYLSPKTAAFEVPVGSVTSEVPAYQRRRRQGRGS